MSRTYRFDNGLNKGRDDKQFGAKCGPDSAYHKGYNTMNDDHGYYGAGGARKMKKFSSKAQRIFHNSILITEEK